MLKFKPTPVDTKLELGSQSRVYCKADGQSVPVIRWERVGGAGLGRGVEDDDGVLTFSKVQYDDAGEYTCTVTSDQGTLNKTISIDVVGEWRS